MQLKFRWAEDADLGKAIAFYQAVCRWQRFSGARPCHANAEFAEAACRQGGMKAIHLDVMKGNLAAENLYKKAGFVLAAEKKLPYQDLGPTPARIFECKL